MKSAKIGVIRTICVPLLPVNTKISAKIEWRIAPNTPPPLTAAVVHVWRMGLAHPSDAIDALRQTLSADERARMARLREPAARERFAITRGLLRATLAYHLQMSPAEVRFDYLPQGKPVLAHPDPDVQFNLSHSREMILCAVTRTRQVGIDGEFFRQIREIEKFAGRFFSENEQAWLASAPSAEKSRVFFEIWTRKEAYLKACGDGVTRHLRGIDVRPVAANPSAIGQIADRPGESARWRVATFIPAPEAIGALAVEGDGWQPSFWQWEPSRRD